MTNKINLDELLSSSDNVSVEEMPGNDGIIETVEGQISNLSQVDREKIDQIKNSIDLKDSQQLTMYANQAQTNIANFSDNILSQVRSKDSGEVGGLLTDLMLSVKGLDEDEGKSWLGRLFNRGRRNIERFVARYETLATQVDKITAQLQTSQKQLLKDINMFDKMYEENLNYFKELEYYIVAGEETVEEMKEEILPQLHTQAAQSDNPMAAQVVKDFQENVNRFEKRVHDLKTSKTIAIQTAPQIKLIQNNDKLLVEKITTTINTTIPIWKSQIVIALGLDTQQKALRLETEISDATNQMLVDNARNLRQSTIEVNEQVNRSAIDVETLEAVNNELIATIEETMQITNKAQEVRKDAEKRIEAVESNLRDALLKVSK